MAWTTSDYRRLGDQIVSARIAAGYKKPAAFAEVVDLTTRTLGDIERGELGKRKAFSRETLAVIERAVGWPPGTWRRILDEPNFQPAADVALDIGLDQLLVPQPENEQDGLVIRRPEGMSDAAWEELRIDVEEYASISTQRALRRMGFASEGQRLRAAQDAAGGGSQDTGSDEPV